MSVNSKPLISVIIPTYNRIDTLLRSLDSVLKQTYTNIEVIIVDDGSTDGTQEYFEELKDDRVKYIRNKMNMGPAGARNIGAENAKGSLIAFQDSDDIWKEDKLEKQLKQMLANERYKMVYCEFARYAEGKCLGVIPSRNLPMSQKQGNLFEYLLLYPLIGAVTILVDRDAFLEIKFDESLQALEDYEFSVRFAKKYEIGFVEEPLIDVQDTPNSVNKRWVEKISAQMHILLTQLDALRDRDLLIKKLLVIQNEAEIYGCLESYAEMLRGHKTAFVLPQEIAMVEQILFSAYTEEQKNVVKLDTYEKIVHITDSIGRLFNNISDNSALWNDEIGEVLSEVSQEVLDYIELFQVEGVQREDVLCLFERLRDNGLQWLEGLQILANLYEICSQLQTVIGNNIYECGICKSRVFYKPISSYYEQMRKKHGFMYWNATFQLENKKNYECPICQSFERDRLIVAFLEKLLPDSGKKLRMLQVAPTAAVEYYTQSRSDVIYESTDLYKENVTFKADLQDMYMVEDETYDVVVCSYVLDHIKNDSKAIKELKRIMKPDGVCIVLVPLVVGKNRTDEKWGCPEYENWHLFGQAAQVRLYGKQDFIRRFEENEFIVNELGKEWFGEEFYDKHGFDENSLLYVMTKQICLMEPKDENMKLTERVMELQEENRQLAKLVGDLNETLWETMKRQQYIMTQLNNLH